MGLIWVPPAPLAPPKKEFFFFSVLGIWECFFWVLHRDLFSDPGLEDICEMKHLSEKITSIT